MDGANLQDLISKGWGVAARRVGIPCKVYRPTQYANPLSSRNRVYKLNCCFAPLAGVAVGASGYNGQLWRSTFDSAYTMPGDYLQTPQFVYFIASQVSLQPIICVQTNSVVTIERPRPAQTGTYSGFVAVTSFEVISEWPALMTPVSFRIPGTLPEAHFGVWSCFLPLLPNPPAVADILSDDCGRRFVIASAQLTALGWRVGMRQVDG